MLGILTPSRIGEGATVSGQHAISLFAMSFSVSGTFVASKFTGWEIAQ